MTANPTSTQAWTEKQPRLNYNKKAKEQLWNRQVSLQEFNGKLGYSNSGMTEISALSISCP
jgi:hypothetical protein